MSKELEKLIETTNKIETCLVGDKLTGQVGLVDKIDTIDNRQCKMENVQCDVLDRLKILETENKTKIKFKKPAWLSAAAAFLGFYKG